MLSTYIHPSFLGESDIRPIYGMPCIPTWLTAQPASSSRPCPDGPACLGPDAHEQCWWSGFVRKEWHMHIGGKRSQNLPKLGLGSEEE